MRMCLLLLGLMGPALVTAATKEDHKNDHKNDHVKCDPASVTACLKNLTVFLNVSSLPIPTTQVELDALCMQATEGYVCSTLLFKQTNCLPPEQQELFPMLVDMSQFMVSILCGTLGSGDKTKPYLSSALLNNSACILKQKTGLDCCAAETHMTIMPFIKIQQNKNASLKQQQIEACCPLTNYLACVGSVVHSQCGDNATNVTSEYIRRAAGEPVQAICERGNPDYPLTDKKICTPIGNNTCSAPSRAGSLNPVPFLMTIAVSVVAYRFL